jgi:hypothetical protein
VGPTAGRDSGARRKILCTCRGSNLDRPIVQPIVRHYNACATAEIPVDVPKHSCAGLSYFVAQMQDPDCYKSFHMKSINTDVESL